MTTILTYAPRLTRTYSLCLQANGVNKGNSSESPAYPLKRLHFLRASPWPRLWNRFQIKTALPSSSVQSARVGLRALAISHDTIVCIRVKNRMPALAAKSHSPASTLVRDISPRIRHVRWRKQSVKMTQSSYSGASYPLCRAANGSWAHHFPCGSFLTNPFGSFPMDPPLPFWLVPHGLTISPLARSS